MIGGSVTIRHELVSRDELGHNAIFSSVNDYCLSIPTNFRVISALSLPMTLRSRHLNQNILERLVETRALRFQLYPSYSTSESIPRDES